MTDLIGVIERSSREEIRVAWSEFKGNQYMDIRVFYLNEQDEMSPTRKGITLRPEQIPQLIELLNEANG